MRYPLALHRVSAMALLGAVTLPACKADCPPGSSIRGDGLCHLDRGTSATGSGAPQAEPGGGADSGTGVGSGGNEDSGVGGTGEGTGGGMEDITWRALPATCTPSVQLGPDPVRRTSSLFIQDEVFAELIDIEVDIARGELWAAGQGGLVGIDVSDPLEPTYLAAVAPFDWFRRAYKMHLGPYPALYGTHRDQGLVAYDRTDPSRPVERTWVRTTNLSGMAHTDDRLYVAGHSGYLQTYDISDPLAPVLLATTSGLGNGWVPLIRGDHLYVADNSLGVVVFDRSNPDAPRHLGQVGTAGGAQDLALSDDGSTLYAAVGGAGVEAFSLEDPASPASISRIDLSYSAIAVSADGDTLWAATQQDIVAIDIRDPRAPVLLNTDETRQWAMSVDADGGRAYVADWGFASVYAADLDAAAPDLDPSTTEVHVDAAGGTATLWLTNLGNDDLALLGATSSAQGLTAAVSAETVAPGSRAWMRIQWAGGGATLDAEICLATNDPDEPQQRISVRSGGSAGQHLGLAAPDFALRGLDGQVHRLSEQIGHPVVLVYFATW